MDEGEEKGQHPSQLADALPGLFQGLGGAAKPRSGRTASKLSRREGFSGLIGMSGMSHLGSERTPECWG